MSHTLQSALESGQKARIVQIDFNGIEVKGIRERDSLACQYKVFVFSYMYNNSNRKNDSIL